MSDQFPLENIKDLSQDKKDGLLEALISEYLKEKREKQSVDNSYVVPAAIENIEKNIVPATIERTRRRLQQKTHAVSSDSNNYSKTNDASEENRSLQDKLKERNKTEYRRIISILKNKRYALDLNQRDIATKAGVSFSNISAIERGHLICGADSLIGYIKAIGCKYADFDTENKYILPELKDAIEDLSEDDQKKVLSMIKTIWPT